MKRSTFKKSVCIFLAVFLACMLSGCWNYRGIDETTIIVGIAIDKNKDTGNFQLSYEIVDLTQDIKQTGTRSKIVDVEGKTLFEAARNAKKRLANKLFFGNTQVIIIDQKIAEDGMAYIIDWFIRDSECRETISITISQEETARELLTAKGIDELLVAYEMKKIIEQDTKVTGYTKGVEVYNFFNMLHEEGLCPVAPAFHIIKNDEERVTEVNGVSVFKGDKLVGFLDPIETNRFLFVMDEIKTGVFSLSSKDDGSDDITLEIFKNKTDTTYSYENDKVKFHIKTLTEVYLGELHFETDLLDKEILEMIKLNAEKKLKKEITEVIKKVQTQFGSDIFGFGNMIYKTNPKLWEKIAPDWDERFKSMDFEVTCEFLIINTASLYH